MKLKKLDESKYRFSIVDNPIAMAAPFIALLMAVLIACSPDLRLGIKTALLHCVEYLRPVPAQ
jgi:hypothetical protein